MVTINVMISNINISVLSGGEQLFLSRLARKEQTGSGLKERELQFINDMQLRGTGVKPGSSKYKQSNY